MRDLFSDRREATVVSKGSLRSKGALADHLQSHHGASPYVTSGDWSQSNLRALHDEQHASNMAVMTQPHDHAGSGSSTATCPSCLGEGRIGVGAGYSTRECEDCGGQGKYEV